MLLPDEQAELFDNLSIIGSNPGGDRQRYLIINTRHSPNFEGNEGELFGCRPVTVSEGGDPSNWPEAYQVWQLVEEYGQRG